MLICTSSTSHCEGVVIRYNISRNDGINTTGVLHFVGVHQPSNGRQ